jgi:hypothetical protein
MIVLPFPAWPDACSPFRQARGPSWIARQMFANRLLIYIALHKKSISVLRRTIKPAGGPAG